MTLNTIGQRIRAARKAQGFTQVQLFEACGFASQSRIAKYEKGDRTLPLAAALKIAEVLQISPRWLVLGEGPMVIKNESGKIEPAELDELCSAFLPLSPADRAATLRYMRERLLLSKIR